MTIKPKSYRNKTVYDIHTLYVAAIDEPDGMQFDIEFSLYRV